MAQSRLRCRALVVDLLDTASAALCRHDGMCGAVRCFAATGRHRRSATLDRPSPDRPTELRSGRCVHANESGVGIFTQQIKAALQLLGTWCSLCSVHPSFRQLQSFPTWLRYVLVAVLVLTGSPPPMGWARANAAHDVSARVASNTKLPHCHKAAGTSETLTVKSSQDDCSCCDGSACQCGCVATLAMPLTLLYLRPLQPERISGDFILPGAPRAPLSRLLRPPIA